jgi:hypothetical protein
VGQFLKLGDVVEVVASHGFDEGGEGHGAAFGVGDGLCGRCWRGVADEDEVPFAHGGEGCEGLLRGDSRVGGGPLCLVEGLEHVVLFGECLAEAEAEGYFAVGEMAEDFGGGPFAGRGGDGDAVGADGFGEGFESCGGQRDDFRDGAAVDEFGVWVEFWHRVSGFFEWFEGIQGTSIGSMNC